MGLSQLMAWIFRIVNVIPWDAVPDHQIMDFSGMSEVIPTLMCTFLLGFSYFDVFRKNAGFVLDPPRSTGYEPNRLQSDPAYKAEGFLKFVIAQN